MRERCETIEGIKLEMMTPVDFLLRKSEGEEEEEEEEEEETETFVLVV